MRSDPSRFIRTSARYLVPREAAGLAAARGLNRCSGMSRLQICPHCARRSYLHRDVPLCVHCFRLIDLSRPVHLRIESTAGAFGRHCAAHLDDQGVFVPTRGLSPGREVLLQFVDGARLLFACRGRVATSTERGSRVEFVEVPDASRAVIEWFRTRREGTTWSSS